MAERRCGSGGESFDPLVKSTIRLLAFLRCFCERLSGLRFSCRFRMGACFAIRRLWRRVFWPAALCAWVLSAEGRALCVLRPSPLHPGTGAVSSAFLPLPDVSSGPAFKGPCFQSVARRRGTLLSPIARGASADSPTTTPERSTPEALPPPSSKPLNRECLQQLRKLTGAPLGDCTAALREADNDLRGALSVLRLRGAASGNASLAALSAGSSFAAGLPEGVVAAASDSKKATQGDGRLQRLVLLRLGCRTDFVSNTDAFRRAASRAAIAALSDEAFVSKALQLQTEATDRRDEGARQTLCEALLKLRIPEGARALPGQNVETHEAEAEVLTEEEKERRRLPRAAPSVEGEAVLLAGAGETVGEDFGFLSNVVGEPVAPLQVAALEARSSMGEVLSFYIHNANSGETEGLLCGRLAAAVVLLVDRNDENKRDEKDFSPETQTLEAVRALGEELCVHIASCRPIALVRKADALGQGAALRLAGSLFSVSSVRFAGRPRPAA